MANDEIPMTKEARMSNDEWVTNRVPSPDLAFGLRHSSFIRHSSFVIRPSGAGRPAASFYFWHFYFTSPRWDLGNAVGR
jgi:hypothetical protein